MSFKLLRLLGPSRSGGRWLTLTFLALYMLSTGGNLFISDGEVVFKTTAELVYARRIDLTPDPGLPQIVPGRDGLFFSKYGLGMPLAAVPFFRLGGLLAPIGATPAASDRILRLVTVSLNAVLGAAGVLLLFLIALPFGQRPALMVAVLYGLATPAWVYSKVFFSEPLLAACLLLATLATLRAVGRRAARRPGDAAEPLAATYLWALLAGGAAGYALLTKPMAGLALPAFGLFVALAGTASLRTRASRLACFGLGALPLVALTLWHNWYRFGSLRDNGYGAEFFSTPWFIGLYGLLASSGRGLLLYAPPTLLALAGLATLWRRDRALTLLVAGLIVPPLLLTARWWAWHGGWGWGPRLIMPYLPLLLLAAAALLSSGRGWRWAWALLVAGALVQLPGVAVDFNAYMAGLVLPSPVGRQLAAPAAAQNPDTLEATLPYLLPDDLAYYIPEYSPIVGQWRMLLRGEGLFVCLGDSGSCGLPRSLATLAAGLWLALLLASLAMLRRVLTAFNNRKLEPMLAERS